MKQVLLALSAILLTQISYSQVAISNPASNPDASAMLDVKSATKGFLMPRVVLRTNVVSPATGLLVYETTSNAVWVYNGTTWVQLGSGGGNTEWLVNGTHIYNGNAGNVGIGITSPLSKFHVEGNALIRGGNLTVDDDFGTIYFKKSNTNRAYIQLRNADNDMQLGTLGFNTTGNLFLQTQGITWMTILPNGNVGIGTVTPDTKLHVLGNVKGSARIDIDGVLETKGGLSAIQGAGLYVTGTSLLEGNITSFGNITSSGTASVSGNINSNTGMTITDIAGTLQFKSNSTTELGFLQLSGNNLRIGTNSGNDLGKFIIRTNGGDRVYVDNAGNVSIGTTDVATGYKVSVAGKVMCEEVRVQLRASWPDYVFNNNYRLMPLNELQNFITQNHHLPNIPKASVIEKEGLQVGEMQKKLMEKVEELTLYILDLQKQIDELKKAKNK